MTSGIRGVVFDACSTLFSFPEAWPAAEAQAQLLREFYNLSITAERVIKAYHPTQQDFDCGRIEPYDRYRRLCATLGLPGVGPRDIYRLARMEQVALIGQCDPFSRMRETLETLRIRGAKVGICSNANPFVYQAEITMDLDRLSDAFVTSYKFGKTKESPEIFLETADRLDLEPRECLFVDDVPKHLDTAKSLGFTTVLAVQGEVAKRIHPGDDFGQDYTIHKLWAIMQLVPTPVSAE